MNKKIQQSVIQLSINEDYLHLVPRADSNQIKSLRNSIKEDGQQVSIIVNSKGVILDGHTRFSICKELNLDPKYVIAHFDSIQKEKEFVVSTNLNRRQLTLFERGEVLFSWWKEERKRSQSEGGYSTWKTRRTGVSTAKTVTGKKERLLQRFARIIGSSASVCHQLTWLLLHAPEDIKIKLRREEITISTAYVDLKNPNRKTVADYKKEGKIYLRYPTCLNCGERTVNANDTDCHVHKILCCLKCRWGN